MAKEDKYGISDLKDDFPSDDKCLEFLFDATHTRECSCGGTYARLSGRKQFQCSQCRYQIAPMAGTIFEKSTSRLTTWFHVLFVFSNAKSGVSAKEIERQTKVTYKTAWRMLRLIREALSKSDKGGKLTGYVEIDEAYFGGKGDAGPNYVNRSSVLKAKTAVIAAVEREGRVRAKVLHAVNKEAIGAFLHENVAKEDTCLMTDGASHYDKISAGYTRFAVNHSRGVYARGLAHVNTTESFWAHVKRSIAGTHKTVSPKYLQTYLNGFAFHRNNRDSDTARFAALLASVAA